MPPREHLDVRLLGGVPGAVAEAGGVGGSVEL